MNAAISEPRKDQKSNMPVVKIFEVEPAMRGLLAGVGGSNMKIIYSKTGNFL